MEVKILHQRLADAAFDAGDKILLFAIDFDRDPIGAGREAHIKIVTLLIRIHFKVTLLVRAVQVDGGLRYGLPVFARGNALEGRCGRLRPARDRKQYG